MSYEGSSCTKGLVTFKYFLVFFSLIFALSFFLISCDDNGNVLVSDIEQGDSSGDTSSDTTPPEFLTDPAVNMAPNPDTPLAGLLEFTADEPVRATVTITDTSLANTNSLNGSTRQIVVEEDQFAQEHSIMLLGFSPDKNYQVSLVVTDEAGNDTTLGQSIGVTTDPLPEGFPPIEVTSTAELMEPGVTLFPVGGRGSNGGFNLLVAVNELGEVVWYHMPPNQNYADVRRLSNGNLIYINSHERTEIIELDMLGNVVQKWNTPSSNTISENSVIVDTERFHHEIFEMQNGNLLVLSVEARLIDNYPTSDSDPEAPTETAGVAGDVIVEFSRDGTIVNEWPLHDMLDPFRIGYGSLGGFWSNVFSEIEGGTRDWTHGNAAIHDPVDDSIIVSLRHQDAVIKFSRQTGELIWIMGPHENWNDELSSFLLDPVGDGFRWQYHQHAPQVTADGTILLFDNGNFRATPFDPILPASENFSRAVEYLVHDDTMQISQIWEYGEFVESTLYSPYICDADALPLTGNVLITFGGVTADESGMPTDNIGAAKVSVHLIEVTHTTPAEKVFELSIVDDKQEFPGGWQTYRAERLPSLYP